MRRKDLGVLEDELDNVRRNRASFERDRQLEFARPKRGSLLAPVAGPLTERFGLYRHESGARLRRRGVSFSAAPGGSVRAPAAGRLRYVGLIRGIGSGAIVAAEEGWWLVLGGVDVSPLRSGNAVRQGEIIGTAISERIYLEVRAGPRGGQAIDPQPLLR